MTQELDTRWVKWILPSGFNLRPATASDKQQEQKANTLYI